MSQFMLRVYVNGQPISRQIPDVEAWLEGLYAQRPVDLPLDQVVAEAIKTMVSQHRRLSLDDEDQINAAALRLIQDPPGIAELIVGRDTKTTPSPTTQVPRGSNSEIKRLQHQVAKKEQETSRALGELETQLTAARRELRELRRKLITALEVAARAEKARNAAYEELGPVRKDLETAMQDVKRLRATVLQTVQLNAKITTQQTIIDTQRKKITELNQRCETSERELATARRQAQAKRPPQTQSQPCQEMADLTRMVGLIEPKLNKWSGLRQNWQNLLASSSGGVAQDVGLSKHMTELLEPVREHLHVAARICEELRALKASLSARSERAAADTADVQSRLAALDLQFHSERAQFEEIQKSMDAVKPSEPEPSEPESPRPKRKKIKL